MEETKNIKSSQTQIEWEPIKDEELFRFETIGDELVGQLTSKDRSTKYNVGLYEIQTIAGETKRILGKTHLDRLMEKIPIGSMVRIAYVEDKETTAGNMKLFEVSVARKKF